MNKRLLLSIGLTVALYGNVSAQNSVDSIATAAKNSTLELKKILKDLHKANPTAPVQQDIADLHNPDNTFTQTELLAICSQALKKISTFDDIHETPEYEQLQAFLNNTIEKLKDYKISGIGFTNHLSTALLYGRQNFCTNFLLKNSTGDIVTRNFRLNYSTLGYQNELIYRFDAIFMLGADLNGYNTNAALDLNPGITLGWRLPIPSTEINYAIGDAPIVARRYPLTVLGFTVLPFAKIPGCMVIAHLGLGFTGLGGVDGFFSHETFNAGLTFNGLLNPQTTN